MSPILRPFNIMAKPVCGVCNLDCQYCYYTAKPRQLYAGVKKFQMTEAVLDSYTRQYIEALPVRAEFGWQGGEPTLAGKDFFRKAVELQGRYRREGQVITNALQTNGTLLDDEWCEFLAAEKFLVGISLDGPPQWHDFYRRDAAGAASFHRAWAGLELLRKHGVEHNVLVTLNRVNAPHAGDLYRYFVNRGVRYLQFIPVLERTSDGRPTEFSCTGEQFGRFCLDVFELWATRDVAKVSERFIDNMLYWLMFQKAPTCCYADRCANAHVLEFNGDLYVCDHFVFAEWKIGNIMERPLAELVNDPLLEKFAALKTDVPQKCRECEYFELCRGGCPKHHDPIGTDAARVNHFCEGYKMFFREALPELKRMAEYFRRDETPPLKRPRGEPADNERQRAEFAAGPSPDSPRPLKTDPAAAPGRNDPCPCGSGRKFKLCCGRK